MTSSADPSSREFFDAKYRTAEDPWDFALDGYELGRYVDLVSHVDPARHRRVFEPGCSIGVLTEMLGQEALGARLHVFSRRTPDDEPRHAELARLRAPVEVLPVRAINAS